jgi:hypothetical protein
MGVRPGWWNSKQLWTTLKVALVFVGGTFSLGYFAFFGFLAIGFGLLTVFSEGERKRALAISGVLAVDTLAAYGFAQSSENMAIFRTVAELAGFTFAMIAVFGNIIPWALPQSGKRFGQYLNRISERLFRFRDDLKQRGGEIRDSMKRHPWMWGVIAIWAVLLVASVVMLLWALHHESLPGASLAGISILFATMVGIGRGNFPGNSSPTSGRPTSTAA